MSFLHVDRHIAFGSMTWASQASWNHTLNVLYGSRGISITSMPFLEYSFLRSETRLFVLAHRDTLMLGSPPPDEVDRKSSYSADDAESYTSGSHVYLYNSFLESLCVMFKGLSNERSCPNTYFPPHRYFIDSMWH